MKPAHRLDPERLLILSEEEEARLANLDGPKQQVHAHHDAQAAIYGLESYCALTRGWIAKNAPGSARAKRERPKDAAEALFAKPAGGDA